MKKLILPIAGLLFVLAGCSMINKSIKGDVIIKEYSVEATDNLNIKEIKLKNKNIKYIPRVNIKKGDTKKIEIQTQEGMFDEIKIDSTSNELKISANDLCNYKVSTLNINIYGFEFEELNLSCVDVIVEDGCINSNNSKISLSGATKLELNRLEGESDIHLSGACKMNIIESYCNIDAKISGSSEIKINKFEASKLNSKVSGSSDIRINNGTVDNIECTLSGSSTFNGENFTSNNSFFKISGSSSAYITYVNGIEGSLSGASNLYYKGSGQNINVSISGSSSINKIG